MSCIICKKEGSGDLCRECYALKQRAEKDGFDLNMSTLRAFVAGFKQGEEEGKLEQCEHCEQLAEAKAGCLRGDVWFCSEECEREYSDVVDYDDYLIDGVGFADPGGVSALRAATPSNPRNLPCPTCKAPNRLTPADKARGYQCDSCADRAERGGW